MECVSLSIQWNTKADKTGMFKVYTVGFGTECDI